MIDGPEYRWQHVLIRNSSMCYEIEYQHADQISFEEYRPSDDHFINKGYRVSDSIHGAWQIATLTKLSYKPTSTVFIVWKRLLVKMKND